MTEPRRLVEHFFRHESGRLVALLTRSLGVGRLDLVEDVVQSALLQALQVWGRRGIPNDPSAWLYRTARNQAIDQLRRRQLHERILPRIGQETVEAPSEPVFADEIGDEPLRLLFLCSHESITPESRVALALRIVGGFSSPEIARALLTSVANVQKRIARAKERLRDEPDAWEIPGAGRLEKRREAVLMTIYLLFNEGYSSAESEAPIRRDLCDEARRLATMLALHPLGQDSSVFALLALIHFHSARLSARLDSDGDLVLLGEQDRSSWDWGLIREGMDWMARSASGDDLSRYHLEAAIAWEHCRAISLESTDWIHLVDLHTRLAQIDPSPLHSLNLAVAEAQRDGPAAGLHRLANHPPDRVPVDYPAWPAVLGELHFRAGNLGKAEHNWTRALAITRSPADRRLLLAKLARCQDASGS